MAGAPAAARPVRPQADADEARRPAHPRRVHQGRALRLHQGRRRSCSARRSSSPSTASRARSSPSCCRTWPSVADDLAVVRSMQTDAVQPRPGPALPEHRLTSRSAGRAWASWVTLRPRHRDQRPARLRRPALRARPSPTAASRCWGSGFLPTVYQGVQFRSRRRPGPVRLQPRRRRRADRSATSLDAHPRPQPAAARPTSATPRSPRASPPTSWPSACRPASPS